MELQENISKIKKMMRLLSEDNSLDLPNEIPNIEGKILDLENLSPQPLLRIFIDQQRLSTIHKSLLRDK